MTHSHSQHGENHGEDWDGIYDADQVWSGNPNDALVTVMTHDLAGLPVGAALDIGCGEGADAVWLATRGWEVTGIDVSRAALDRGRAAAARAGEVVEHRLTWICSDVAAAGLRPESFDLVGAFYPALRKDAETDVLQLMTSLVGPGGALVFVHHAEVDRERALAHGFDPDVYLSADDVVAELDTGWVVQRREAERHVTEGRGAHHSRDVVLVARPM